MGILRKTKREPFAELLHTIRTQRSNEVMVHQSLSGAQIIEVLQAIRQNSRLCAHLSNLELSCTSVPNREVFEEVIEIADFPKLGVINIINQGLSKVVLGNLPSLYRAEFNQNFISEFKAINAPMQTLRLRSNRLTEFNPGLFPKLERLDLADNLLTVLDNSAAMHLKYLDVNANPLNTLIISGAPLTQNITFHSAALDPVSSKILSLRKIETPDRVADHAETEVPDRDELQLSDAEINSYLALLLKCFKDYHAPSILTITANFFHQLYVGSRLSSNSNDTAARLFSRLPDEILLRTAMQDFEAMSSRHLRILTRALRPLISEQQHALIDSFVTQSCTALSATARDKLWRNTTTPGSKLYSIIQSKLPKAKGLGPNTAIISAPPRNITPGYAAYRLACSVGHRLAKVMPSLKGKERSKVVKTKVTR